MLPSLDPALPFRNQDLLDNHYVLVCFCCHREQRRQTAHHCRNIHALLIPVRELPVLAAPEGTDLAARHHRVPLAAADQVLPHHT